MEPAENSKLATEARIARRLKDSPTVISPPTCERLLQCAMTQQGLSVRAHDRILKVSRTVADIESGAGIEPKHIAEAIRYRTLDRTFWA
ncbi:MAG TPA: hypothetical protein VJX16_17215 [Terriglobales bacterium]|nr:hypothetical protein [Terriglobales bacterium]